MGPLGHGSEQQRAHRGRHQPHQGQWWPPAAQLQTQPHPGADEEAPGHLLDQVGRERDRAAEAAEAVNGGFHAEKQDLQGRGQDQGERDNTHGDPATAHQLGFLLVRCAGG